MNRSKRNSRVLVAGVESLDARISPSQLAPSFNVFDNPGFPVSGGNPPAEIAAVLTDPSRPVLPGPELPGPK
jgi:hypothetical protein